MTMHVRSAWQLGEPIEDHLVDRFVQALRYNRQKHKWQPAAFTVYSPADEAYYVLSLLLDAWNGKLATPHDVEAFVEFVARQASNEDDAASPEGQAFHELCRRVVTALLPPTAEGTHDHPVPSV